jgi:hypothetical protein
MHVLLSALYFRAKLSVFEFHARFPLPCSYVAVLDALSVLQDA